MMAAIRRTWGYKHFECTPKMEEVISSYASRNKRTFSKEVKTILCKVYSIPEDEDKIVLPPLIAQVDEPTSERPGKKRR